MIEPICTLIAVAVVAVVVVALYYRICHAETFWRTVAAWHRSIGRYIAQERYICDVRKGLERAAATGAAMTGMEMLGEWLVEPARECLGIAPTERLGFRCVIASSCGNHFGFGPTHDAAAKAAVEAARKASE